jgi:hypothetical protein
VRDHYGHCAWEHALERFLDTPDPSAYSHHLGALYPLLSPPVIDVQTSNRLVRLERHQGEYGVFSLMLVSYKKMFSSAVPNPQIQRNLRGFCADFLMRNVERLPPNVLAPERARRVYFNGVLTPCRSQQQIPAQSPTLAANVQRVLHLQPRSATACAPHRELVALEAMSEPAAGVYRVLDQVRHSRAPAR